MKLINLTTKEVISQQEFLNAHPNVSFPIQITAEIYEIYGFAPVFETPAPAFNANAQKVVESAPVLTDKGIYEQAYTLVNLTAEELAASYEAKTAQLEQTRAQQVVSMRQARLALLQQGVLAEVEAAVAAMPGAEGEAARITWEYATEVKRSDALVQALASQLAWTAEQLDALFALALTL